MTPTAELRIELREMLDETIPEGGSGADTRFTDDQIDRLLSRARCTYTAAAEGWSLKAAKLQRELGEVARYSVGSESYDMVNLQTAIRAALDMVEMYRGMAGSEAGSMMLGVTPPEVL